MSRVRPSQKTLMQSQIALLTLDNGWLRSRVKFAQAERDAAIALLCEIRDQGGEYSGECGSYCLYCTSSLNPMEEYAKVPFTHAPGCLITRIAEWVASPDNCVACVRKVKAASGEEAKV